MAEPGGIYALSYSSQKQRRRVTNLPGNDLPKGPQSTASEITVLRRSVTRPGLCATAQMTKANASPQSVAHRLVADVPTERPQDRARPTADQRCAQQRAERVGAPLFEISRSRKRKFRVK